MERKIISFKILQIFVLIGISLATVSANAEAQEINKDRTKLWKEDIGYLKKYLPALDKTFTTTLIAERKKLNFSAAPLKSVIDSFYYELEQLEMNLEHYTDNEIMVNLSKVISMSDNAHTRLYLFRNRTELRMLPVLMHWFDDGLYIIRSTKTRQADLGLKVISINTFPVDFIKKKLDSLCAGTTGWKTYMSNYFVNSPDILSGAGLSATPEHLALTLEDATGHRSSVDILPLPLVKSKNVVEGWWKLSPVYKDSLLPFSLLRNINSLPLYLKNVGLPFKCTYIGEAQIVYLQINRTEETGTLTWKSMTDTLTGFLKNRKVKRIVLDVRFNTGGNAAAILPTLEKWRKLFTNKPCTLITSGTTFSAGIIVAAVMKHKVKIEIIGQESGDELQFWAEGGNIILPNSKLTVHYANGYHDWTYDQTVSISPVVKIPNTFRDYRTYKDAVMQHLIATKSQ